MGTVFWTLAAFFAALVGFGVWAEWLDRTPPECPKCQRPRCAPCDPDCEACTGAPTEFPRPQYLQ